MRGRVGEPISNLPIIKLAGTGKLLNNVFANTFILVHSSSMRQARIRGEGKSYYHCISRVVDRQFVLKEEEKISKISRQN